MFSTKTQIQLSTKCSRRTPLTSDKKSEGLIYASLLTPSLVSLVPIIVRYDRGLSLAPVWIYVALGALWYLLFYLGHRVTKFEKFKEMSADEKRVCLLYDSFWYDLMRSGFGLYTFIGLIWGVIEFGLGEGQVTVLSISLLLCVAFVVFCFVRWGWIVTVAIDGLQRHRRVRDIIAVVMGLIAAFPLFGGIVRMVQVTMGQSGLVALVPFFLLSGTILAIVVFAMTFLGITITYAHYHRWRNQRKKLMAG